jgi:hypothetical protein
MTELELYKFINDNSIEWSKEINDHTEDILIFPYTFQMDRFVELVKDCDFDEGLICRLKGHYFAIWMSELCKSNGIDMNNVFKEEL